MLRRFVRRLEPFLYSRRNIVGSLLAVGGLTLYFAGVLGGILWLPVVVGLYLIGVLLVPGEPGLDLRLDAAEDAAAVRSGLDRVLAAIKGRVADDIYARVSSIRDTILATLRTDTGGVDPSDPNVYLIRQTALDYLPAALSAYLAVPRTYAEHRAVAGGRTPHDVLLEQLELMDGRMHEVLDDMVRHDSDRLLAHGQFLAEKFSPSSLQVGTEAVTDAVAAPQAGESVAEKESARERERVH